MDAAQSFMDTAFEMPVAWPALEPHRVPQSKDWTDAPIHYRHSPSTPPRAARLRTDPRVRMPLVQLTSVARSWLQDLPLRVRPGLTAKRHPHVVNRIALVWDDRALLDACFADLLVADRVGRQGFGLDVLEELLRLQSFSAEPRRR